MAPINDKFRLNLKISELESQLKTLRIKSDLHSTIERDLTKRRANTMKLKSMDCGVQTEKVELANPEIQFEPERAISQQSEKNTNSEPELTRLVSFDT